MLSRMLEKVNLRVPIVEPPIPWWIKLRSSLKSLSALTSENNTVRVAGIMAQNRTPDVMSSHPIVLSDLELAKQWEMRYSEDNVNVPGFQISQDIVVVLGMPILFFL